jgi:threonine dehydrogenase-like Zn-dependent dehydrogenase
MGRDGAFAEFITVPVANIVEIPGSISDNDALFIEPLAAALEIQEQLTISPDQKVLLIGDGKLAHLIALTLLSTGCNLEVKGKHEWKLDLLRKKNIRTINRVRTEDKGTYDIVIEASGTPGAFQEGLTFVRPRGCCILKSTYTETFLFNPSAMVVNEITVLGSRCGQFRHAVDFLCREKPDLSGLISARVPLVEGIDGFGRAQKKDAMKVIIDCR